MKVKMTFSTVPYEVGLKQRLRDRDYAVGYLRACIKESALDMPEVVLSALRDVAEVHGMTWLAKETGIPRQTLYQMLSKKGNPRIRAFATILRTLGMRMTFERDPEMPVGKLRRVKDFLPSPKKLGAELKKARRK